MPITQSRLFSIVSIASDLIERNQDCQTELKELERRLQTHYLSTSDPDLQSTFSSLENFLSRTIRDLTPPANQIEAIAREKLHYQLTAARNAATKEYAAARRSGQQTLPRRQGSAIPIRAPSYHDPERGGTPKPSRKGLILPDHDLLAQETQFDKAFTGDPSSPDLFGAQAPLPPEGRGGQAFPLPPDDLPLDLTYAQARSSGRFTTSELHEMFSPEERGAAGPVPFSET